MATPPAPKKRNTKGEPATLEQSAVEISTLKRPGRTGDNEKSKNFKVSAEWAKEWEIFAKSHDMSEKELLMKAFALYKETNG